MAESILAMSTRLAGRAPTKRKMIFAITDGEDDNGPQTVRKACEHATRLGVEVIGLTIDAPAHPGFTMQANVSSRGKIEEAGLGVLVRALERCAT